MQWKIWVASAFLAFTVSACGETVGQQALYGGATGAGVGYLGGGDPLAGAIIGAGGNVAFCQLYPHRCQ
jgi:hypothetical protein